MNLINSVTSGMGMNLNLGSNNIFTSNQSQSQVNNINVQGDYDSFAEEEEEEENDEIFLQKKNKYILELDEFQYKHVEKFSSVKEEKCAICIVKFKGVDIIKEFPCKHIFHKKCILKWLKQSNKCPLCKHDITEEINQVSLQNDDEESDN